MSDSLPFAPGEQRSPRRPTMDRLLSPRSIAMVGASNNAARIGGVVFANLKRCFGGSLVPVHPAETSVMGLPAYPSIRAIPDPVDLAVIAVPAATVPEVVEEAAARGIGGAVILTSGFAEVGGQGEVLQTRLAEIAGRTGIQLIGPNCIGTMNLHGGVMANFSMAPDAPLPRAGGVAVVSQSGGFGSFILAMALKSGLQLGHFVSTGNEVDCSVSRVLRHLVDQAEVRVMLACAEAIREPEVFIQAAQRGLELDKPIVLLKAGRTPDAARAALRHTGSVAGSASTLDAICRQYGVHIAHTMQEMLDYGLIFQNGRRAKGKRLGIITTSGGAGVALADEAAPAGLTLPELTGEEQQRLRAEMPEPFYGSVANPVDTTAQIMARPSAVDAIYELTTSSSSTDLLAFVAWAEATRQLEVIVECYKSADKPLALLCTEPVPFVIEAGIPLYRDPGRAVRALGALARQSLDRPPVGTSVAIDTGRGVRARALLAAIEPQARLPAAQSAELLADYGVSVASAGSGVSPAHIALRCALRRDPDFGPMVVIGFGGSLDEVCDEVVMLRPPFDRAVARRALKGLHGGRRWLQHEDEALEGLAAIAVGVGQLSIEIPDIREIDIRPIHLTGGQVMATAAAISR